MSAISNFPYKTTTSIQQRLDNLKKNLVKIKLPQEIEDILKLVKEILEIKEEKNAIILGHNYMTPEVFYGLSDFYGDSLGLAKFATETDAEIILFNGVLFMAETAKILNPSKKILIADKNAGCSLAESITGADVCALKKKHPNIPVVSYINCSAEVKAESDIICTSANAQKIIDQIDSDTVIFLPDQYLADNIQKQTPKKIIKWSGKCMVHELFSPHDIIMAKQQHSNITILAHPECSTDVTSISDFTGSTTQIDKYIEKKQPKKVMLMTECSMSDNLQIKYSDTEFISTCQTCPHMKKITLEKIKDTLINEKNIIEVDENIQYKAKKALDKMLTFL